MRTINTFSLILEESHNLFAHVALIQPSGQLKEALEETLELATNISTKKAISELIITPILLEIRRIFPGRIGYFSGVSFEIDENREHSGICDFILSASGNQLMITAPAIAVVKTSYNDIEQGIEQCIGQMVTAQMFNSLQGQLQTIYGVVSTGTRWKFLVLEGQILKIDIVIYSIKQIEQILGILAAPFQEYFSR